MPEKTYVEWFETIDDPIIKAQALKALVDQEIPEDTTDSLEAAIDNAFDWVSTGDDEFWCDYSHFLGAHRPMPLIPSHWVIPEVTRLGPQPAPVLPDTGARREWPTGAVRDASEGKPEVTQLYPPALLRLAQRGTDGAAKYSDYNWAKGIPKSAYVNSAFRHLTAYLMRDTSEDHLGAVLWNIMGLMYTEDMVNSGGLPSTLDDLNNWKEKPKDE